jgi:hypothetical protein
VASTEKQNPLLPPAAEFGTRMKRERVPLSGAELPIRTASYPAIPEPSMSHGEYTKTTGFGGDKKPLVRAALHAVPEAVVPLYRSQEVNRADVDAVEFGTRIPEVLPEAGSQPRDFPIRKTHFFLHRVMCTLYTGLGV